MVRYSVVIPVYGNSDNIADLLAALRKLSERFTGAFEAVFVVDASPDDCWEQLERSLPAQPFASQLLLHSRNFGSFLAVRSGMEAARGEIIGVMAADLQEPPELMARFFDKIEQGDADIVFGQREGRDDPFPGKLLSDIFWAVYSKLVMTEIPRGGVDVFGCSRKVRDSILAMREANSSLVGQCFWVGYRRAFIPYRRAKRLKGRSQWNFRKRMKYLLDSVFSFTDLPLRLFMWTGALGIVVSFLLGMVTLVVRLFVGIDVPGYTMIILFLCFGFATLLFTQGIVGCYLWRCFENTKDRPLALVARAHSYPEDQAGTADD